MAFTLDLGGLVVHLGGEMSSFNEMIANAQAQVKNVTDRLEKMGEKVGEPLKDMGESIMKMGGVITAPIVGAAHVYASFGSSIAEMSERLGVSAQVLTEFNYAATQSGATLAEVEHGMRFMQRNISGAMNETDRNENMFSQLKLSVGELKGMKPDEQFLKIADAIGQIDDPAKRTAAAMGIFGRGSTKLIPLMKEGSARFNELRKEARELGMTFGTEDAEAAHKFDNSLLAMYEALKMISFAVGKQVAPYLQGLAKDVVHITGWVIKFVQANGQAILTALKLGGALTALGMAIYAVGSAIAWVTTALGAFKAVMGVWTAASWATLGFYGAILLCVAGVILLLDTLAGMAGWANFGVAKMVESFRVGGMQIGTWFTLAWLAAERGWMKMYFSILETWDYLKMLFQSAGLGKILQAIFIGAAAGITKILFTLFETIVSGFTWVVEQIAGLAVKLKIIDPDTEKKLKGTMSMMMVDLKGFDKAAQDAFAGAMPEMGIDKKAWAEHQKMVNDNKKALNAYGDAAQTVIEADRAAGLPQGKIEEPGKTAATATDPFHLEKGAFKQMSLNRFAINGPDLGTPTGTQKVQDFGVMGKLDVLIGAVKKQNPVPVLG